MAFQKTNAAATVGTTLSYKLGNKIKQEPLMTVRSSNGGTENNLSKETTIENKTTIDPLYQIDKPNPVTGVDRKLKLDP